MAVLAQTANWRARWLARKIGAINRRGSRRPEPEWSVSYYRRLDRRDRAASQFVDEKLLGNGCQKSEAGGNTARPGRLFSAAPAARPLRPEMR